MAKPQPQPQRPHETPEAVPAPRKRHYPLIFHHSPKPTAHLWPISLRANFTPHVPGSIGYFADKDIFLKEVFKQFSHHETQTENTIFFSIFKKMTGTPRENPTKTIFFDYKLSFCLLAGV
jgi:hypothetical protein